MYCISTAAYKLFKANLNNATGNSPGVLQHAQAQISDFSAHVLSKSSQMLTAPGSIKKS